MICAGAWVELAGFRVVALIVGFFFAALAAVVASKKLLPNNARHKPEPNPTGARGVVALGLAVVLGLAVITTGALVVIVGAVLAFVVVIVSVYFFVGDMLLDMLGIGDVSGNKSIIIGSEDNPNDVLFDGFLITFTFAFEFAV